MKYSVIIPTCNQNHVLESCIESIKTHTDLENLELIIVANGCDFDTKTYLENLDINIKLIWDENKLGFSKAVNLGILNSTGEYIILLNDDTILLDQPKNEWLTFLENALEKQNAGLSGPVVLHERLLNVNVIFFFCVMIKREVITSVGLLDEIYNVGGCEDIDFCIRAIEKGYTCELAARLELNDSNSFGGGFPIWHKGNNTLSDPQFNYNQILNQNKLTFYKKYMKNLKLNLGSGPIPLQGYINLDLYDDRADIKMDITKLDFDDNSVEEILASHVFEHISPFKIMRTILEWRRVLKPGGKLVLEMPNIEELCRQFLTADKQMRYRLLTSIYGTVNTRHSDDPEEITSPHLFGWYPEIVYDHLSAANFREIQIMPEQIPGHDGPNFRVEAIK